MAKSGPSNGLAGTTKIKARQSPYGGRNKGIGRAQAPVNNTKNGRTPTKPTSSIVGTYTLTCEAIARNWPREAQNMTLRIHALKGGGKLQTGIYTASFDLGVLSGTMQLCADYALLEEYVDAKPEPIFEPEDDEELTPSFRERARAFAQSAAGRRSRASASPKRFYLCWRGRETGEGMIQVGEHWGMIKFIGPNNATLKGEMEMLFVGRDGRFDGERQISEDGQAAEGPWVEESWDDLSEDQYEKECVSRWH